MTLSDAMHVAREPFLFSDSEGYTALRVLRENNAATWIIGSLLAWFGERPTRANGVCGAARRGLN